MTLAWWHVTRWASVVKAAPVHWHLAMPAKRQRGGEGLSNPRVVLLCLALVAPDKQYRESQLLTAYCLIYRQVKSPPCYTGHDKMQIMTFAHCYFGEKNVHNIDFEFVGIFTWWYFEVGLFYLCKRCFKLTYRRITTGDTTNNNNTTDIQIKQDQLQNFSRMHVVILRGDQEALTHNALLCRPRMKIYEFL